MSNPPVALVTGAANRIGATIARVLHRAGYSVIVHYRNSAEAAHALITELNAARNDSRSSRSSKHWRSKASRSGAGSTCS